MNPRFLIIAPLLLLGYPATALDSAPTTPPVSAPMSPDKSFDSEKAAGLAENAAPLVAAQNDFGARLASRLQDQNDKNANLLISPTSIWQAMTLTAGGARGETKTQLSALLALQNLPDDKIGAANRAFNSLLSEQKGASISVANSVWFADSFEPNADFVKNAAANFDAGVETFPEANPAKGASLINDWVSQHTQKEIPQIVSEDNVRGQSAVLVNAVYFHGTWKSAFDKAQTKPAPFHLEDGKTVDVPTMNGEKQRAYLSGTSFEGARLPYGNTNCALWVLLPKVGMKPADVLSELGGDDATKLYGSGSVVVSLPRFDIEWRTDLRTNLAAMNSPLPFNGGADFSAMGSPANWITAVLHVAKMKVDEEGTVASAATAVTMSRSAVVHQEPKVIKFDRPFVVALVEETSGARLFEGVVNNPSVQK